MKQSNYKKKQLWELQWSKGTINSKYRNYNGTISTAIGATIETKELYTQLKQNNGTITAAAVTTTK